mgnify:FL=1
MLVLLVSIQLLIEKNKDKFVNLYSLGYSVPQIASPYLLLVSGIDIFVWLLSASIVTVAYPRLFAFISLISPGLRLASLFPLWLLALLLASLFVLMHYWMIRRQLRRICITYSR